MEEQIIAVNTYYLLVLKKIVAVHIRHLEGHIRNLERMTVDPEDRKDPELYFLQAQLEEAKIVMKFLDVPCKKANGWLKEAFDQIMFPSPNHKRK